MAPLGFLGGTIPEAYGGPGIDHLTMALGIEEMSRVCIHMGSAMGRAAGPGGLGHPPVRDRGAEAALSRAARPGETFAGTAVTEPHSGTDVAAMETTVVRRGDEYILNGAKTWISGVGLAEWYLTFATLDRAKGAKGVCAFVVERVFPGFSERPIRNKDAFRPAQVGQLVFEDCRVPVGNLVGREGEGLKVALCAVENGRLSVACRAVGLAQGCLDASVLYARQRVVLGQPIARYQLVQAKIADMVLGIESARFLTYRLAWLKAQGVRRARRESSIAKLYASEMAFRGRVRRGSDPRSLRRLGGVRGGPIPSRREVPAGRGGGERHPPRPGGRVRSRPPRGPAVGAASRRPARPALVARAEPR